MRGKIGVRLTRVGGSHPLGQMRFGNKTGVRILSCVLEIVLGRMTAYCPKRLLISAV